MVHISELTSIGFSEKEAKVYLALLQLQKADAQTIAKQSKLPRTSVYGFIESLLNKGVINRADAKGSSIYVPNNPQSLLYYIQGEKRKVQKQEELAHRLSETLSQQFSIGGYSVPKLKIFEGKKDVEAMLYRYLPEWQKSYEKLGNWTMWGYQDHTFVEQYRGWHDHAWEERSPREKICLFSNEKGVNQQNKDLITNREIRPLPKGIEFSSSIWVHGEFIILAMTRHKPHYAIVLVDTLFSENLRAIFQMLWMAKFSNKTA